MTVGDRPQIDSAPGLTWKPRRTGWEARWQARTDLIKRGYPVKTQRVWQGAELDEEARSLIQRTCQTLQAEMLSWSRNGPPQPDQTDYSVFWDFCKRVATNSRHRANLQRVPHTIDYHHLETLFREQKLCCAVSGLPFTRPGQESTKFRVDPFCPSVDRIIPSVGYVPGNVRIVCAAVNAALNEWGLETLMVVMDAIKARQSL